MPLLINRLKLMVYIFGVLLVLPGSLPAMEHEPVLTKLFRISEDNRKILMYSAEVIKTITESEFEFSDYSNQFTISLDFGEGYESAFRVIRDPIQGIIIEDELAQEELRYVCKVTDDEKNILVCSIVTCDVLTSQTNDNICYSQLLILDDETIALNASNGSLKILNIESMNAESYMLFCGKLFSMTKDQNNCKNLILQCTDENADPTIYLFDWKLMKFQTASTKVAENY